MEEKTVQIQSQIVQIFLAHYCMECDSLEIP